MNLPFYLIISKRLNAGRADDAKQTGAKYRCIWRYLVSWSCSKFIFLGLLALLVACEPPAHEPAVPTSYVEAVRAATARVLEEDFSTASAQALDSILLLGKEYPKDQFAEEQGNAYRVLGLYYYYENDHRAAEEALKYGLRFDLDQEMAGRIYCNLGLVFHDEDDYLSALVYFDSTRSASHQQALSAVYLTATTYAGDAYIHLGQYHAARQYLREALDVQLQADTAILLLDPYLFLSDCERYLEDYAAAIRYAADGMALFSTPEIDGAVDPDFVHLKLNLGNAWQDSLRHNQEHGQAWRSLGQTAISHYEEVLSFYRRNENIEGELIALQNLGELHRRLGFFEEAQAVLQQGLQQLASLPDDPLRSAQLLLNRGETFLDQGLLDDALADLQTSFQFLMPSNRGGAVAKLPPMDSPVLNRQVLLANLGLMAQLEQNRGEWDNSMAVYDSLIALSHHWRNDFITDADKHFLTQELHPHLEAAFALCASRLDEPVSEADKERAFRYSEEQKAVSLLEKVRFQSYVERIPAPMRNRLGALRRTQEQLLSVPTNDETQPQIREQWNTNFSQLKGLKDSIYALLPAESKQQIVSAVHSVNRIREVVLTTPEQSLVEYFLQDTTLHLFYLDQQAGLQHYETTVDSTFFADIDEIDVLLAADAMQLTIAEKDRRFCAASHRLFQKLIAPIRHQLHKRLIIIPDPAFLNLPFEALWMSPEAGGLTDWNKRRSYLLYDHDISYCYSASLLLEMSSSTSSRKKRLATFASSFPSSVHAPKSEHLAAPIRKSLAYLTPLNNQQEIEEIRTHIRTQPYAGKEANKAHFLEACAKFSAIHIASHSVLIDEAPQLNFIAFTQGDTLQLDELLYLYELYNLDLNIDLASFSACRTARGKFLLGEGNLSLARGLASAGVRSIATTLWDISRSKAQQIFPVFYRELAAGAYKDQSLSEAKQAFIEAGPANLDPSMWAGIILIGNTNPIHL